MNALTGVNVPNLGPSTDTLARTKLDPKKIDGVATQFESLFMSEMLKQMRQTLDTGTDGMFAGDTSDVYGGLFDMYLGQHIAQQGGLGIGKMLKQQLAQHEGRS